MSQRFYCEECGFEVFPGQGECEACGARLPRSLWDKPATGPTMAERAVAASEPEPGTSVPPIPSGGRYAEYPRSGDNRCAKCGVGMDAGVKRCPNCGYSLRSPWEQAAVFALLLMSTACVCCGPCMIGASDSSGASVIILAVLFLGLYIWGWVWYARRYR